MGGINNMTVGKQYSLSFYDSNTGEIIDFGDVQNVKITANSHLIKSEPYNDVPRFGFIPDGYTISFTIVRTGPSLENYQLAQDALFNAGGTVTAGTLNETITEGDGSVSRYQYTGFVFHVDEIGDLSRNNNVKMMGKGQASDKVRTA